jgi:hypothetical protein
LFELARFVDVHSIVMRMIKSAPEMLRPLLPGGSFF